MKLLTPFLLLSFSPFTHAFDWPVYMHVPSTVTADVPFQALLDVEPHNGDTTYVSTYRIYLASSPTEQRAGRYRSDCYLEHSLPLCDPSIEIASDCLLFSNTTVMVTIPANVGPPGPHYVLQMQLLQTDGSYYSTHLESNIFTLEGASGEWGPYKLQGHTLWGDDNIPCGSFECVKDCSAASYLETYGEDVDEGVQGMAYLGETDEYRRCANRCEGVRLNTEGTMQVKGRPTTDVKALPTECPVYSATASATTTTIEDGSWMASSTRTRSVTAAATGVVNARAGVEGVLGVGGAVVGLMAFL